MRIIDADILARKLDDMIREGEGLAKKARDFKFDMATIGGLRQARKMIDLEPSSGATHGRWKNKEMYDEWLEPTGAFRHRCSKCMYEICTKEETLWWFYCPNCGAKMDGGE